MGKDNFMKIINGYRVEKDSILKKWIAFKKLGINGWLEVKRKDTFKEIKNWCNEQPNVEKRK